MLMMFMAKEKNLLATLFDIPKKDVIEIMGLAFLFFLILFGVSFVVFSLGDNGIKFIISIYFAWMIMKHILKNKED